jgi:hypothetical protein
MVGFALREEGKEEGGGAGLGWEWRRKGKGFSFYESSYFEMEFKRNLRGIRDEFERGSRGICYRFVHSKQNLNSRP